MRKTTPVSEYMSRLPHEIDCRESLSTAMGRMALHEIRHLPVMDGPRLVGMLSRHDVQNALRVYGGEADLRPVGDVCTREPLLVSPATPVADAARHMVARAVTSILVVDDGVLVGIFTSIDALRVLADV